jgi:hypothetical protein
MEDAANHIHHPDCMDIALRRLLNINRLRQRAKGTSLLSVLPIPQSSPKTTDKTPQKCPQNTTNTPHFEKYFPDGRKFRSIPCAKNKQLITRKLSDENKICAI